MKKQHLPTKICPVCNRSFTWRKKWAKDWDEVKYCSERCKRNKNKRDNSNATNTHHVLRTDLAV
ncbi:DUF2256 domain-containing protein [Sediminitomix flava]|uniref:DUF2256 domain-containing protein n=1 Tax=Sediminitomix flava TaxID=379075 RepID=UPI000D6B9FDA|nr:DUF2256 domain-containing protein [Sediminitomix flava]